MSRETRQKMFDPFFTTKFAGRGLGCLVFIGQLRRLGVGHIQLGLCVRGSLPRLAEFLFEAGPGLAEGGDLFGESGGKFEQCPRTV